MSKAEKYILTIWLIANLTIGLLLVHDFGMSYDEPNYYLYAQSSVDAYKSVFGLAYIPVFGPSDLPDYGPAFILFPELGLRLLKAILPNISAVYIWHYSYFFIFQLGGLCLYSLARRWFKVWSAWGILILYTFQPVLWGHAFINPKDVPFMAFYLFTLWSGLRLADAFGAQNVEVSLQPILQRLWSPIEEIKRQRFTRLFKLVAYIFLVIAILIVPLNSLIRRLVTALYSSDPASFWGKWFHVIAPNGTDISLENYIHKAQSLLTRIELTILLAGALILLLLFIWLAVTTWNNNRQKEARVKQANQIHYFTRREFLCILRFPRLILAGVLLGLTISIRVLGPLPGMIVILYLAIALRQKSIPVMIAYLFYAAVAAFLTWPYLWTAPIAHFIESAILMSSFPWPGRVLFNGHYYPATNLPASYLPVLLNVQLTETLLLVIYVGFLVLIWSVLCKRVRLDLLLVVIISAILPLIGLVVLHPSLYDNFRQVLFILPPLILLAGLPLDISFSTLRPPTIRLLLLVALAFPGIFAIIRLHPYEYIYYNSLVGGVRGADGHFELDYWRTSLPNLALELNKFATPHSKIVATGFLGNLLPYMRDDISLERLGGDPKTMEGGYDYAILSGRYDSDKLYPHGKILLSVEREGAVLGLVKAVKGVTSR